MNNRKIRVAITHGDTNGIGYELIFKTFAEPEMLELCTPIIYGSPKVAAYHHKALGIPGNFTIIKSAANAEPGKLNLLPVFDEDVKVELGVPTPESGRAAVKALDRAITDYKDGLYDVLVTNPVDKQNMHLDGFDFTNDHFIEMCLGEGKKGLRILINGNLRVALLTNDVPLREVPAAITTEHIVNSAKIFIQALERDLQVSMPRIAVLALNPNDTPEHHAQEEAEAIVPAIEQLCQAGMNVFGPYQADRFYEQGEYTAFDGILAMYHDQGMAPVKALDPRASVRFLAGLPLVTTSPDQTPEFGIAGTDQTDPAALRHAIYLAIDAFRNRETYDEAASHPLPKLYHERKDESEKVRFAIPKKHENVTKDKKQE